MTGGSFAAHHPLGKRLTELTRSTDAYRAATWTVIVAQALWLGLLSRTGWYYQDDFTFTAQASGRSLGWDYLSDPVNEHFTPGLRAQFWLFRNVAPLDYSATIGYRLVLQALCTFLLARLLLTLFGRRPVLLVALVVFAFSPLIVPGFMWLASATNLLPSQALAITAVHRHVVYVRSGRLREAMWCGLCLGLAALFWEKTATISLALPVLTLAFLFTGPVRSRLREAVRRWPGWLVEYAPLAALGAYFVLAGYGRSDVAGAPGPGRLASLIADAWTHTFAPTLVGAPWHWFTTSTVYVAAADPPVVAVLAGQVAFVAIALIGIRRLGWRSLFAWLIPGISMAVGVVLVATGRYRELGALLTRVYSYSYDVALPLVLGVCLALLPVVASAQFDTTHAADSIPATPVSAPTTRVAPRRLVGVVALVAVVSLLASEIVSGAVFVRRWSQSPAQSYFARLDESIRALPPGTSIYDTPASIRVLPFFNPVRNLSDVLPLAGLHPAYDADNQEPMYVTDSGSIVPSAFVPAATARPLALNNFCSSLVRGDRRVTLHLARRPGRSNWFLRLTYFRRNFAAADIQVLDSNGDLRAPLGRPHLRFSSRVGTMTLRLPKMNPTAILLTPRTLGTNVCITSAAVGAPYAAGR